MRGYKTLNLEAGLPTVEEARQVLLAELLQSTQSGVPALKVIHGYGSSGKGGALRGALRKSLLRCKKEGLVTRVIFGEKWNISKKIPITPLNTVPGCATTATSTEATKALRWSCLFKSSA